VAATAATVLVVGVVAAFGAQAAGANPVAADHHGGNTCQLGNGIDHVVQIQFDNVHFTRDNPNIASDLEQMPNLSRFLEDNGTILSNDHDVLVHTATNFVSAQTGLYEDRTSITQSNSFDYYDANGGTHPGVSFAYWTAPLFDPSGPAQDTNFNLDYSADRNANPTGDNANVPAPWATYTKAGCNVGEVGMANTVLENIAVDIPTVFGANSPEAAEVAANPTKATADFEGLSVHCAQGSSVCATGRPDLLPDQPGGYTGFKGLFGAAEIQPAIHPSGPITSLSGATITDASGNPGFPGFDSLTPDNSLGLAANMLEHGVPVVNAYVSDAHTDHVGGTGDFGPGEAGYEQQLSAYDSAFGAFLQRMSHDGITTHNTLFVVTTDEGDHFSGSAPTPANCSGAPGNFCTYATKSEVNVNLTGLLASQFGDTTKFAIHSDPAPALWVAGNPSRTSATARTLEREVGALSVVNPLSGATDKVANLLADPVEEKILHFVGPDPARTPTFTAFSGEDEFVTSGPANCNQPCAFTSSGFAWNHGTITADQTTIWLGLAGPGVRNLGVDRTTFADQTDVRPTELALVGLRDQYQVDGRVLIEDLKPSALPSTLRSTPQIVRLGQLYKQIMACEGSFALDTLAASTRALNSGTSTDDSTYASIENQLTSLDNRRDQVAARIGAALLGAAFDHRRISPGTAAALSAEASALLAAAHHLASS
jgi:hypothetical protein